MSDVVGMCEICNEPIYEYDEYTSETYDMWHNKPFNERVTRSVDTMFIQWIERVLLTHDYCEHEEENKQKQCFLLSILL